MLVAIGSQDVTVVTHSISCKACHKIISLRVRTTLFIISFVSFIVTHTSHLYELPVALAEASKTPLYKKLAKTFNKNNNSPSALVLKSSS